MNTGGGCANSIVVVDGCGWETLRRSVSDVRCNYVPLQELAEAQDKLAATCAALTGAQLQATEVSLARDSLQTQVAGLQNKINTISEELVLANTQLDELHEQVAAGTATVPSQIS